ncbi:MAG: family 10 glycosylhydrolase [Leptolyngbyaceae cyanobacterium HOT.MB2.61]|nr:family 10 glycosylhydrolase [Leptolyngbyaceae cyanobacterium HOT.MB2.61]
MEPMQFNFCRHLVVAILATGFVGLELNTMPAQAQISPYCQQTPEAIAQKDRLRQATLKGDKNAQKNYMAMLRKHAEGLRKCRQNTWTQDQAIWIRLYPCDARPGTLDAVFDQIVNRGYNQIYVETFYNGRVLLPATDNPTPWPSVMAGSGRETIDLLAQAIQKGRQRGLKVYAWLFSMNFGANYVRRPDRQQTIARNGLGQTSLNANTIAGLSVDLGLGNPDEAFIDPYSPQARQDYGQMVRAVARRKPDGILFDYIRYPRSFGAASVASKVQDLWIYGDSSWKTLLQRALNYKGMDLINRYLSKGYISGDDLREVNALYPKEKDPSWQGLNGDRVKSSLPLTKRLPALQSELWNLAVAHAYQGVIDFLLAAAAITQEQRIPAGAVFFPEGNATVGKTGFDSRMQPWDRFPSSLEWHPMAYATCGDTSCIVSQVQRVLSWAAPRTLVKPVLAGIWQESVSNRPPLEVQMEAIRRVAPNLKSISHFAYSWQEPASDRERKFCRP